MSIEEKIADTLLAPAEQYVYRKKITNRLHSSGVLCAFGLIRNRRRVYIVVFRFNETHHSGRGDSPLRGALYG